MNIKDLNIFIEVANSGGISPDARRLGLSKSIISRRLAALEEELGVQLLSRTTLGSVLTDAGSVFREHALRVVSELNSAREALSSGDELIGQLRIAAPLSFGTMPLAPIFAELARRHPQLQVDTSYSDHFVDLVDERFDCAIRIGLLPDSGLISRRIFPFKGCLVASAAYLAVNGTPKTLEDLTQHRTIVKKGDIWQFIEDGKTTIVRPQGHFFTDNGETILATVLADVGIAYLPDFMIKNNIDNGTLMPLLTHCQTAELGMYVVWPPGRFPNNKVRALIEILVEQFDSVPADKAAV